MPRHRPPTSRARSDVRLEPSHPAAHRTRTYRCYLPVLTGLGTVPLHGTRPSSSSVNRFRASGGSQGGSSVPLTRISGYRAPRAPHLAQPIMRKLQDPSTKSQRNPNIEARNSKQIQSTKFKTDQSWIPASAGMTLLATSVRMVRSGHLRAPPKFKIQHSSFKISKFVELSGIEPLTCALRTHRSPN